jgi:hypothetical protein
LEKFIFLAYLRKCGQLICLLSIIIVASCSTYGLGLQSFFVESGVMQYYIPQTKWKGKNASAISDFTYRQSNSNDGAICNISFILKKSPPRIVNTIKFIIDGNEYLIEKITPMFREHSAKLVRVSMNIKEEYFIKILTAKSLKLTAKIDGLEYEFSPSGAFLRDKKELYDNLY